MVSFLIKRRGVAISAGKSGAPGAIPTRDLPLTRLVGAHIPLSEVGRVLGHTQANTTYRHVNANVKTAKRAAAALHAFNGETQQTVTSLH